MFFDFYGSEKDRFIYGVRRSGVFFEGLMMGQGIFGSAEVGMPRVGKYIDGVRWEKVSTV